MANQKKMVEAITSRDEDFAKWYTDIVKKAELVDYSGVKGCMVIRPYGYAIWENMQKDMDERFKKTGHENVYMPMFIPESLLSIDNMAASKALMTHLIRLGHREIAHLTVSPLQMPYQDRLNGYISALEEHKIPVDNELISYGEPAIKGGYDQMWTLLAKQKKFTSLNNGFCFSNASI